MVTLEEFYQKHFDCPVPFRKSGRLTKTGAVAHERLVSLLNDLESLCSGFDARIAICQIDKIAGSGISYRQEMINDLYRFVTSEINSYVLDEPVTVISPSCGYFDVKYLSRDSDYKDIFMTEERWKVDEDNNIDIYDFGCLGDEDAERVFQAILCQEIEKGWEWMEHAREVLKAKLPDEDLDEAIDAFVCENWQNMATDAWNLENFADSL